MPGSVYVCVGFNSVLVFPSPKSQPHLLSSPMLCDSDKSVNSTTRGTAPLVGLALKSADARKLSTEAQQQIRNQAIRLRKSGRTYKEISEITDVHLSTIARWHKAYERNGTKAIRIKKRGRTKGSCRKLPLIRKEKSSE